MDTLALTVTPVHGETATSLASRLSVRNGVGLPGMLCRDLGLDWKGIIAGEPDKIARLARMAGADSDELMRFSPRSQGDARYSIGGEVVNKFSFSRLKLRVCPFCIGDDIDRNGLAGAARRVWWQLAACRTCLDHHVPLVELAEPPGYLQTYDFISRIEENLDLLRDARASGIRRAPTPFERYATNRLFGSSRYKFLDGMQFHVALRLCEVLGVRLIFGPTATISEIDDDALRRAGAAGFDALACGKKGFKEALTSCRSLQVGRRSAHRNDLGALYNWLVPNANCPEHCPVVDFVSEYVFESYSIATGRTVLKRRCPGRRIYSITTASRDFGVSPKRLGMLLVEKGLAQHDGNSTCLKKLMTEDEARKSVEEARELLTRLEASEKLNVSTETFDGLVRQDVIQRRIGDQRYVANFPASDLDQLLERVFASAKPYKICPADLVGIHRAAKSRNSIATIVSRILEGGLTHVGRLVARRGIPALLVDPHEVRGKRSFAKGMGFTKSELAELLGVKTMTISHLIDQGILSVETRISSRCRREVEIISQASVERFMQEFITLTCLARYLKRKPGPLCQKLIVQGVSPIPVPDGLNRIFRRADVERSGFL